MGGGSNPGQAHVHPLRREVWLHPHIGFGSDFSEEPIGPFARGSVKPEARGPGQPRVSKQRFYEDFPRQTRDECFFTDNHISCRGGSTCFQSQVQQCMSFCACRFTSTSFLRSDTELTPARWKMNEIFLNNACWNLFDFLFLDSHLRFVRARCIFGNCRSDLLEARSPSHDY